MEIKLFGKKVFEYSKGSHFWEYSLQEADKETILFDFYRLQMESAWEVQAVEETEIEAGIAKAKKKADKPSIKPKKLYELKTLNDGNFSFSTDAKYIEGQLEDFKDKLNITKREGARYENAIKEIGSVITRMKNRKSYPKFKDFYEQFPYTTTTKIKGVVDAHSNLLVKPVSEFIADMPKEAVKIMKDYDKTTKSLCKKDPVYYVIADKKDFKKTGGKRDPILLAQSPFGHFWQILGAWDEEMLFLEEL